MRWTALILLACVMSGCAGTAVVMRNPRNGDTATCSGGRMDLDPWAQADACVARFEAQGWIRSSSP